jgi:uncharacterized membrane protein/mono/diheme cytochrome c family protein
MAETSDLAIFVGRFHIVLLHLPIGILVLLAGLEAMACLPRFKTANASAGSILLLAVPASLVAAACGWLLATGGEYDENSLFWHRWLGVATVVLCMVTAVLHRFSVRGVYRLSLLATVVALTVASHLGGTLTHGKDFLTRHAPGPLGPLLRGGAAGLRVPGGAGSSSAQPAYAAVVQPILDRTCVSCHGAEKQKGKLRLDSFESLLEGGDAGPTIQAGRAAESELMKRLLLPPDHDDHMPPEGKPQPTADEIALLKWWIDAGASPGKTVAELNPGPEVLPLIEAAVTKGTSRPGP